MNSLDQRCGLSMAVGDAVANLKSKARMISTSEEIAQVCQRASSCILQRTEFYLQFLFLNLD